MRGQFGARPAGAFSLPRGEATELPPMVLMDWKI